MAIGTDFSVTGNMSSLTQDVLGFSVSADFKWVQYDWRLGGALVPSEDAQMAVVPYLAVALRAIDGVSEIDSLPNVEPEFDARLIYGMGGLSGQIRTASGNVISAEIAGMLGDVTGFSFTVMTAF